MNTSITSLITILVGLASAAAARAACPQSIEEAGKTARPLLIQAALNNHTPGGAELGKELSKSKTSATAGVGSYKDLYLMQIVGKSHQLNGVVQCDSKDGEFRVLTFSWSGPEGNGVTTL